MPINQQIKVANQAWAQLDETIDNVQTTIDVVDVSLFPTLGVDEYFYGTLVNAQNQIEIVRVTDITGVTLTVERGAEGTTPRGYTTVDRIELRVTAATIFDLYTQNSIDAAASEANAAASAVVAVSSNIRSVTTSVGSSPDVIQATGVPAFGSYTGELVVTLELTHGANTIPNPTFEMDGLGPKPIVRENNQALIEGDTGGNGAKIILAFSIINDAWVLINPSVIDNANIADGSIAGSKITNNSITATQIGAGAVGSSELASGSVGSAELQSGSVGTSELIAPAAESDFILLRCIGDDPISFADNDGYPGNDPDQTKKFTQGYDQVRVPGGFNVAKGGRIRLTWQWRVTGGFVPGTALMRVLVNGVKPANTGGDTYNSSTTSSTYVNGQIDFTVSSGDHVAIQTATNFGSSSTHWMRRLYVRSQFQTPAVV